MKRNQNFGVDYRPHPIEKWVKPLVGVGVILAMGVFYGLTLLVVGVFQ